MNKRKNGWILIAVIGFLCFLVIVGTYVGVNVVPTYTPTQITPIIPTPQVWRQNNSRVPVSLPIPKCINAEGIITNQWKGSVGLEHDILVTSYRCKQGEQHDTFAVSKKEDIIFYKTDPPNISKECYQVGDRSDPFSLEVCYHNKKIDSVSVREDLV